MEMERIHTKRCIKCDEPVQEGTAECPKCGCSWNRFYEESLKSSLLPELEYENHDGEITITGYSGSSSVIEIPNFIEGCPVKEIGDYAFKDKKIVKLTIPLSVRRIGDGAFMGGLSIEELTIVNHLTELGEGAFVHSVANVWVTMNVVEDSPFHQWLKEVTHISDPMVLKREYPNLTLWPKEW